MLIVVRIKKGWSQVSTDAIFTYSLLEDLSYGK